MENKAQKRIFQGVVVSDKMDKTIVVRVDTVAVHPKYRKRYIVSKRFHVHDEKNLHKVGEKIRFVETRPISRHKKWRVLSRTSDSVTVTP
ncbi:MAG: 30S ribosomal protein S17 [bacterium]|nr:30S ribosomal protein S17 [bacterium]